MKNSWEWTVDDVLELINNGVPESLKLDYKRSDSLENTDRKKNELSKDISAFANSAGGMLIYGVIESGHLPTQIDEGVDPNDTSKEWIENVINSRVQRRVSGIRINQIKLLPPSTNVIYVLDIPQSNSAPHMASDNRFYKRFNFVSVPMEEYEVRDVGNRNIAPDLEFKIQLLTNSLNYDPNANFSKAIDCNILLYNSSMIPSEYTLIQIYIDSRLNLLNNSSLQESDKEEHYLQFGIEKIKSKRYSKFLAIPNSVPILQGINFLITSSPVSICFPNEKGIYYILAQLSSPRMEQKEFLIQIIHDGEKVEVIKND